MTLHQVHHARIKRGNIPLSLCRTLSQLPSITYQLLLVLVALDFERDIAICFENTQVEMVINPHSAIEETKLLFLIFPNGIKRRDLR